MTASLISLSTAILALLGIVAFILLAARLLRGRRFGFDPAGQPAARLTLHQTIALDTRRRVRLLTCDDRRVVLLTGGPNDIMLSMDSRE